MKAEELDSYLTCDDRNNIEKAGLLYKKAMDIFPKVQKGIKEADNDLVRIYGEMGHFMQEVCKNNPRIHVYSFDSHRENHSEASRIIAKLRDVKTSNTEFVYYTQRAYEMLFKLAFTYNASLKNHFIVKTPVTDPVQNYAVHNIANVDSNICSTVMCVMLRAALLPSMIMSKEIKEYSTNSYITPFALFRIYRNDSKNENNMEYILDLDKSFFDPDTLNGRDLIFADPMNATGGSLVTVIKYLIKIGVKPKSVIFFNIISALKGALRIVRALDNCDVYTLWIDGALNDNAYIMPGLGDAGDRINGCDSSINPRNIIQLLCDYGSTIADIYRSQYIEIENTVFGRKK